VFAVTIDQKTDSTVWFGIDAYGNGVTSVAETDQHLPKKYALSQNYPNPFNPSTIISFDLPVNSFVSLKVFDLIGREVALIVSEELSAGSYSRTWNAASMSNGVYFYRLQARQHPAGKPVHLSKLKNWFC